MAAAGEAVDRLYIARFCPWPLGLEPLQGTPKHEHTGPSMDVAPLLGPMDLNLPCLSVAAVDRGITPCPAPSDTTPRTLWTLPLHIP